MSLSKRLAVGVVLAALALPAAAAERVYLLRSQEHPSVTPDCPAGDTVRLGALLYAPRTRASDGYVTNDIGEPIGTAIGCGKLVTFSPFGQPAPFSMLFVLPEGSVTAQGTCTITSLSFPIPNVPAPLLLVGCALTVNPDASLGIVNGIATSASVFTPVAIPGYGTGSFWTLQVYVNDAASDARVGARR